MPASSAASVASLGVRFAKNLIAKVYQESRNAGKQLMFLGRILQKRSGLGEFEMRIFDHTEYIPERIENGGDTNSFADALDIRTLGCAER